MDEKMYRQQRKWVEERVIKAGDKEETIYVKMRE